MPEPTLDMHRFLVRLDRGRPCQNDADCPGHSFDPSLLSTGLQASSAVPNAYPSALDCYRVLWPVNCSLETVVQFRWETPGSNRQILGSQVSNLAPLWSNDDKFLKGAIQVKRYWYRLRNSISSSQKLSVQSDPSLRINTFLDPRHGWL